MKSYLPLSLTLATILAAPICAADQAFDWTVTPRLSAGFGSGVRTASKDLKTMKTNSVSDTNSDSGGLITEGLIMGTIFIDDHVALLAGPGFYRGSSKETIDFTYVSSKTEITNDYSYTGYRMYAGLRLGGRDSLMHFEATPFIGKTNISVDSETKTGSTLKTVSKSGSATTYGGTLGGYLTFYKGAQIGIRAGGYGGDGSVEGSGSKTNVALVGVMGAVDVGYAF